MPIMNAVTKSPNTSPARRSRIAASPESGATMVEFALVAVVLFSMIFLVVEGAFAVRARSTMSNAIDDAARRGAVAAASPSADYQILFQLTGRGAQSVADIEYVAVYKTTSGSAAVPANCAAGIATSQECNVYRPADFLDSNGAFNAVEANFSCTSLGTQWCTTSRGSDPNTLEFIGVYVQADYRSILSGFFDWSVNVSGSSLQAIETSGE